jgi:hypothetical protein
MFESGPGGDFATYVGAATGSIYRLDMAKLHYQNIPLESLLKKAQEKEGKVSRVPEEIECKICGIVFSARWIPIDREELVEAYEL